MGLKFMTNHKRYRRPIDMVIYMYINTVTEMVYIGSSMYGLEHRHKRHLKESTRPDVKKSRFYKALTSWPAEFWEMIVIERCSTERKLDRAEAKWIAECSALNASVGYNTYDSRYLRSAIAGGEAMKQKQFSPESRLKLSLSGKKGAAKRTSNMSLASQEKITKRKSEKTKFASMTPEEKREQFREWGRKGAERSRLKRILEEQ